MTRPDPSFDIVWEVESPVGSDLTAFHDHLRSARTAATTVLVPDNHTARATVSSIAVARHVNDAGLHAIACLNARDRNLLGLRRDLLTCGFEGVDEVLLVYGDEPGTGSRAPDLNVRTMLAECRTHGSLRVAVTTRLTPIPTWKLDADRLFVQVSYDLDALLRWRDTIDFDGPVVPAVIVLPSVSMARSLAMRIPGLRAPDAWIAAVAADPLAGVELAVDLTGRIRDSGAFAGVHLVAGRRHHEVAAQLSPAATRPHPRARVPAPV